MTYVLLGRKTHVHSVVHPNASNYNSIHYIVAHSKVLSLDAKHIEPITCTCHLQESRKKNLKSNLFKISHLYEAFNSCTKLFREHFKVHQRFGLKFTVFMANI